MKTNDEDIDAFDFSDEAAFNRRFRRVGRDDLPESIKRLRNVSLRDCKSRITLYLDADIVAKFRELGERDGAGYQTLINQALRKIVDEMNAAEARTELKEELLNDEQFLGRLKEKLAA